jgi:hypothetical protein
MDARNPVRTVSVVETRDGFAMTRPTAISCVRQQVASGRCDDVEDPFTSVSSLMTGDQHLRFIRP